MRFLSVLFLLILIAILGGLTVLAFAPWGYWPLAVLGMAVLLGLAANGSPKRAFWLAWLFGAVFFSFGLHWLYISVNVNSPQPAPPIMAMGIVALLTIPLGLFFALPIGIAKRISRAWSIPAQLLLMVAFFALFEWLRGWLLTGFPWLSLGFSQIDSPLSGYAPIGGVHLITLVLLLSAAALVLLVIGPLQAWRTKLTGAILFALLFLSGLLLQPMQWSEPTGQSLQVALVQGNIPQRDKWRLNKFQHTLDKYARLSQPYFAKSDVIIWPEVAIPAFYNDPQGQLKAKGYSVAPPRYLAGLRSQLASDDSDLLVGATWLKQFNQYNEPEFYNSLVQVDPAASAAPAATSSGAVAADKAYHKRHLVPFGEYSPLPDSLTDMIRSMGLPAPNTLPGEDEQTLLVVDGVPLGVSICYEDVFARDVLRDLPEAQLLVNVSNDAWFAVGKKASTDLFANSENGVGRWLHEWIEASIDDVFIDSPGPHQHHEMARMRAAEARRYLVRSTNTGVSGFIDPWGAALLAGPQFQDIVLTGKIEARAGATPFVSVGHWLMVGLSLLCIVLAVVIRQPKSK